MFRSGVFALRGILLHSPTFNTCRREMQCPKNIMAAFLFKNEAVKEDN